MPRSRDDALRTWQRTIATPTTRERDQTKGAHGFVARASDAMGRGGRFQSVAMRARALVEALRARALGNEQRVDLSSVCPVFKITTPRLTRKVHVGETQQIYLDHKGGSRPRRRLGRLKGTQRETLLKESVYPVEHYDDRDDGHSNDGKETTERFIRIGENIEQMQLWWNRNKYQAFNTTIEPYLNTAPDQHVAS